MGAAASFGADVSFTLVGNSSNVSGTNITGGRATFSSITVDGTTLSSGDVLDGSSYSWAISFSTTIDNASSWSTNTNVIFSTSGGSNGSGPGLVATQDGTNISYYLVDDVGSTGTHVASGDPLTVESGTTITLSWDAVASTLTLSSTGVDSLVLDETDAVSLTVGVSGNDDGGIESQTPSGSIFWTNGGQNNISGITLTATAVPTPEPSMFGLLAGLGALGLVATRRRRSRKA